MRFIMDIEMESAAVVQTQKVSMPATNYARRRAEVIAALGGKCSCCGQADPRRLKYLPRARTPKDWQVRWDIRFKLILASPENYHLLCLVCDLDLKSDSKS
jgi:hypothetical protein